MKQWVQQKQQRMSRQRGGGTRSGERKRKDDEDDENEDIENRGRSTRRQPTAATRSTATRSSTSPHKSSASPSRKHQAAQESSSSPAVAAAAASASIATPTLTSPSSASRLHQPTVISSSGSKQTAATPLAPISSLSTLPRPSVAVSSSSSTSPTPFIPGPTHGGGSKTFSKQGFVKTTPTVTTLPSGGGGAAAASVPNEGSGGQQAVRNVISPTTAAIVSLDKTKLSAIANSRIETVNRLFGDTTTAGVSMIDEDNEVEEVSAFIPSKAPKSRPTTGTRPMMSLTGSTLPIKNGTLPAFFRAETPTPSATTITTTTSTFNTNTGRTSAPPSTSKSTSLQSPLVPAPVSSPILPSVTTDRDGDALMLAADVTHAVEQLAAHEFPTQLQDLSAALASQSTAGAEKAHDKLKAGFVEAPEIFSPSLPPPVSDQQLDSTSSPVVCIPASTHASDTPSPPAQSAATTATTTTTGTVAAVPVMPSSSSSQASNRFPHDMLLSEPPPLEHPSPINIYSPPPPSPLKPVAHVQATEQPSAAVTGHTLPRRSLAAELAALQSGTQPEVAVIDLVTQTQTSAAAPAAAAVSQVIQPPVISAPPSQSDAISVAAVSCPITEVSVHPPPAVQQTLTPVFEQALAPAPQQATTIPAPAVDPATTVVAAAPTQPLPTLSLPIEPSASTLPIIPVSRKFTRSFLSSDLTHSSFPQAFLIISLLILFFLFLVSAVPLSIHKTNHNCIHCSHTSTSGQKNNHDTLTQTAGRYPRACYPIIISCVSLRFV